MTDKNFNIKDYRNLKNIKLSTTFGSGMGTVDKNKNIINSLDQKINKILNTDISDSSSTNNILKHLLSMNRTSITGDVRTKLRRTMTKPVTESGIKSVFDIGEGNEEILLAQEYGQKISNSFVQMNEYRICSALISELEEILNIVSRDVLNINEVDKKLFNNIFDKNNLNQSKYNDDDEINKFINTVNTIVEKEVIKRNDLENRIKKYIVDSLTIGAKPVLVTTYKDMLMQVYTEAQKNNINGVENYNIFSNEVEKILSEENLRLPNLRERAEEFAIEAYSKEDFSPDFTSENMSQEAKEFLHRNYESFYDKILGNSVNILTEIELNKSLESKSREIMSREDLKEKDKDKELAEFKKALNDSQKIEEVKEKNKNFLKEIVNVLDQKIEIIDPVKSQLAAAKSTIQSKISWLKYKDSFDNSGVIDDGSKRREPHVDYTYPSDEPLDSDRNLKIGARFKNNNDPAFSDKLKKLIEENDDVLIVEYEADRVIPIYMNGVPLFYYVIEEDKYNLFNESRVNKTFSFAEIFGSIGIGNDAAIGNTAAYPSALAGNIGMGNNVLQNIGNMMVNNVIDGGDALKKNEILKELVYRTISTKLDDPYITDNKAFRDSIINLIKDGYIIDKKVKITCIPASSMIYFGHDVDSDGVPHSLFKNVLLYCYLYLSSVISSAIIKGNKASNRDKVSVNIGLSKRIGTTIRQIEHEFGTKTLWNAGSFRSLNTILSQLGSNHTVYEPIFDGEKAFEYNEMQKINDVDIDDDFTDKILEKIISNKVPNSMMNKLSEDEYSKSIDSQNIKYRNKIIDMQKKFSSQIEKLLYLTIKNTRFENEDINKIIKNSLRNLEFSLKPPDRLNTTNFNDIFGEFELFLDNIVKIFFGDDTDSEESKYVIREFKKKLCRDRLPIDLDEIEKVIEECRVNASSNSLEKKKKDIINQKEDEILPNEISEVTGEGDSGGYGGTGSSDFGSDSGGEDSEEEGEGGGDELDFSF